MGRAFRYQKRTAHIVVGVAEHSMGVEQRAAAAAAEAESSKGVKGAVKKARAALTGQQQRGTKKRPAKSQSKPDLKKK
jgi:large subunit ribosomal protein L22